MVGCGVPTGAFHGFEGVGTAGTLVPADGTPPGIIKGADNDEGPGGGAGTGMRPAAAAAAMAGSS